MQDPGDLNTLESSETVDVYQTLPTDKDTIRLLRFIPKTPIMENETLSFSFETTELPERLRQAIERRPPESQLAYHAISYTWGNNPGTATILLNNQRFTIPGSAEAALRGVIDYIHESSSDFVASAPLIWIDAVCINQTDVQEKQYQIPMMGRLYSRAKAVVVWLGQHDALTETARKNFDALICGASEDSDETDSNGDDDDDDDDEGGKCEDRHRRGTDEDGTCEDEECETCDYNDEWEEHNKMLRAVDQVALLSFLSLPWFTRLWVVQEVALNRATVLVGGRSCILWWQFEQGLKRLFFAKDLLSPALIAATFRAMTLATKDFVYAGSGPFGLAHLMLSICLQYSTSNPWDKIYGILGLREAPPSGTIIIPDYSRPLVDVYREATWYAICNGECLSLLHYALGLVVLQDHFVEDWPSWVPRYHELEIMDPRVHGSGLGSGGIRRQSLLSNARVGVEEHLTIDTTNSSILNIRGVVLSTTASVCIPDMSDQADSAGTFLQWAWDADITWHLSGLTTLALSLLNGSYFGHSHEDVDILDSTLVADFSKYLLDVKTHRINSGRPTENPSLENLIQETGGKQEGNAARFRDEILWKPSSAIVVTDGGNFARSRDVVRPGDLICVWFGLWNPLVLRPVGDDCYKLRGPVYVPGAMHGEYLDFLVEEGRLEAETRDFSIS